MAKKRDGFLECESRALLAGVCVFGAAYCVLYFTQLYAFKTMSPKLRITFPTVGAAALSYAETYKRLRLC